ncbi:hypothetical protein [Metabacillus sediminilitoris]|uniref:Uncharacterized protein n=1 Tax=Metabacillus sediminilitoris TaxID=2567941 RepID=A0A4V3WG78_9BACI|nr:hypothetical protein [Metabacillus sediminilitoris]QGQ47047.1 hypothetical protein GMB29_18430 [Metabacillus sediminilitoris]THF83193.1 hypothetical protein E6W99_02160 [Metabacillus sediminilitoris]
MCKAKEQLERYVGLFFIPIFEKDSWKTERKESLKASWALSRPMGSFSPIQIVCFYNTFNLSFTDHTDQIRMIVQLHYKLWRKR